MGDTNNNSDLRTTPDRTLLKESADEVVPSLREQPIPPPSAKDRMLAITDEEGHRSEMLQWEKFHQSYLSRRSKYSDTLISQCRAQANCSPRVDAWNRLVDTLNSSHLDALTKIQAVNVWVNEAIYYFDKNPKNIETAFETLSTGTGICGDIARLKYETLRAVGISDKDMRLVSGHIYDSEDNFLAYHEILLVNADGQNLILNDNVTSGHFIARPSLLHGGVESAGVYILGKEGGSVVNNFGRFIPLAADSEGGTKSYPTAFNEKGRYILPSSVPQGMPPRKSDDAGARCTIDGKFCIDMRDAGPSGQSNGELILQHVAEAIRLRTSPLPKADSHETPIKSDVANLEVPKRRGDSRSPALKVEALITETDKPAEAEIGNHINGARQFSGVPAPGRN
jgi:predicted transglutaminase-like cysteine proteinase